MEILVVEKPRKWRMTTYWPHQSLSNRNWKFITQSGILVWRIQVSKLGSVWSFGSWRTSPWPKTWASRFCWVSSLSRFISALSWSAPSSDVTTSGLQLEDCLGCLLISRIVSDSSSSGSGPSLKRQKRNSGHFLRSTQLTPWFLSSSSLVTLK